MAADFDAAINRLRAMAGPGPFSEQVLARAKELSFTTGLTQMQALDRAVAEWHQRQNAAVKPLESAGG